MDHSDSEGDTPGIVKLEGNGNGGAILLEGPSLSSPDKLSSVFSLTFQEFQLRSGKNFGSMNIDELLNSVWAMDGQDQNQNQDQNGRNNNGGNGVILPQQGGSFTIPTPLCNKTVQEVWAEIEGSQENNPNVIANGVLGAQVTLRDFLAKVGVIDVATGIQQNITAEVPLANTSMNFSSNSPSFDTNNIITDQPMMDIEFSQPNNAGVGVGGGGGVLVNASSMYPMFAPNENFVRESSKTPINGNGTRNNTGESSRRRRMDSGSIELDIERRQRRMIKNRESAARSRARKQAYTAELEIELNQLREEIGKLRLILHEEAENKAYNGELEIEVNQLREEIAKLRLILQEEVGNKQSQEVMNANLTPNVQTSAMEKWKALRRTTSLGW